MLKIVVIFALYLSTLHTRSKFCIATAFAPGALQDAPISQAFATTTPQRMEMTPAATTSQGLYLLPEMSKFIASAQKTAKTESQQLQQRQPQIVNARKHNSIARIHSKRLRLRSPPSENSEAFPTTAVVTAKITARPQLSALVQASRSLTPTLGHRFQKPGGTVKNRRNNIGLAQEIQLDSINKNYRQIPASNPILNAESRQGKKPPGFTATPMTQQQMQPPPQRIVDSPKVVLQRISVSIRTAIHFANDVIEAAVNRLSQSLSRHLKRQMSGMETVVLNSNLKNKDSNDIQNAILQEINITGDMLKFCRRLIDEIDDIEREVALAVQAALNHLRDTVIVLLQQMPLASRPTIDEIEMIRQAGVARVLRVVTAAGSRLKMSTHLALRHVERVSAASAAEATILATAPNSAMNASETNAMLNVMLLSDAIQNAFQLLDSVTSAAKAQLQAAVTSSGALILLRLEQITIRRAVTAAAVAAAAAKQQGGDMVNDDENLSLLLTNSFSRKHNQGSKTAKVAGDGESWTVPTNTQLSAPTTATTDLQQPASLKTNGPVFSTLPSSTLPTPVSDNLGTKFEQQSARANNANSTTSTFASSPTPPVSPSGGPEDAGNPGDPNSYPEAVSSTTGSLAPYEDNLVGSALKHHQAETKALQNFSDSLMTDKKRYHSSQSKNNGQTGMMVPRTAGTGTYVEKKPAKASQKQTPNMLVRSMQNKNMQSVLKIPSMSVTNLYSLLS